MTYLAFHFVFILPPILLLLAAVRRHPGGVTARRKAATLAAVALIALVYTTPWDNYLIWRGVWGYGADRVVGTIGYVPVEEYLFFLLQPLLTGLWTFRLAAHPAFAPVAPGGSAPRWVGGLACLALTVLGAWALGRDAGVYAGLILAWAAPVLGGQWAFAGPAFWAARRLWAWAVAVPTVYLWVADRIALHLGIWEIADAYTTGVHLFGLPLEEALFFLVTNLLVVQGVFLFAITGSGVTAAAAPGGRSRGARG